MRQNRELGLLWGVVALAMVAVSPLSRALAAVVPACPFKSWLATPCPTCGTTRAALALAELDLGTALSVNPLAALAWIGLVGGGLIVGVLAVAGHPLRLPPLRPTLGVRLTIAVAILANWAYLVATGA